MKSELTSVHIDNLRMYMRMVMTITTLVQRWGRRKNDLE